MSNIILSEVELADRLKVDVGIIRQYVKAGMPIIKDVGLFSWYRVKKGLL